LFLAESPTAIVPLTVLAIYFWPRRPVPRARWRRVVALSVTSLLLILATGAQLRVFHAMGQTFVACATEPPIERRKDPRCTLDCLTLIPDRPDC